MNIFIMEDVFLEKTYKIKPAVLGEENYFNSIKIEIMDLSVPVTKAGEWTDYEYNFGHPPRHASFLLKIFAFSAFCLLGYIAYNIYITRKKYKGTPNDLIGDEEDKGMPGGNIGFSM